MIRNWRDWLEIGLSHYVKLERKPESGCELKTAYCGNFGIMLTIELTKFAVETENRDFEGDMQHGTATVMPLVEPWFNTSRNVCADYFFASVCSLKLWDVRMRFSRVVKTATRMYPMSYLSSLEMERKGDHSCLVSGGMSERPGLMAVCGVDRDRRYFICSVGMTKAGRPVY